MYTWNLLMVLFIGLGKADKQSSAPRNVNSPWQDRNCLLDFSRAPISNPNPTSLLCVSQDFYSNPSRKLMSWYYSKRFYRGTRITRKLEQWYFHRYLLGFHSVLFLLLNNTTGVNQIPASHQLDEIFLGKI